MEIKKNKIGITMVAAGVVLMGASAWAGIDQASVDKCKTCHEETVAKFLSGSHHGKAWGKGDPDKKYSCESCHGSGEKHIAAGGSKETILRFGKDSKNSVEDQAKQCLACHGKNPSLALWNTGKHIKNDVACASCHGVHMDKNPKSPDTCFACHKDIKVMVSKLSHHPLMEGKVACSDCHNPHGALSHGMIKADNVNQLCYKCHADKRGPFIFEHDPVEENCMTCHQPHGTNHRELLVKEPPFLCKDCHTGPHGTPLDNTATMGGSGTQYKQLVGRGCLNCHSHIHGTNGPSQFLLR